MAIQILGQVWNFGSDYLNLPFKIKQILWLERKPPPKFDVNSLINKNFPFHRSQTLDEENDRMREMHAILFFRFILYS